MGTDDQSRSGTGESSVAGKSDWEDQDLLTLDLAAERLDEEIKEIQHRIAAAREGVDCAESKLRVAQLIQARQLLTERMQ